MSNTYDQLRNAINTLNGINPKDVDAQLVLRTDFYFRQLYRLVKSIYKVSAPDTWDINYFLDNMLLGGVVCVTDTTAGVLPLRCGTTGINIYDRPTECVIANHVLGNFNRTIGVDCEIVYVNYTFEPITEFLMIYAQKLASCDGAIDVNLINSKAAMFFECESKADAETAKAMYDDMTAGKPAVFYHKSTSIGNGFNFFTNNVKNTFVADMIQSQKRTIIEEFLTAIGINNANTDKKERLVTDEVNSNNQELLAHVQTWHDNTEVCVKKVNNMFGNILTISMPYYDKLNSSAAEQTDKGGDADEPT